MAEQKSKTNQKSHQTAASQRRKDIKEAKKAIDKANEAEYQREILLEELDSFPCMEAPTQELSVKEDSTGGFYVAGLKGESEEPPIIFITRESAQEEMDALLDDTYQCQVDRENGYPFNGGPE